MCCRLVPPISPVLRLLLLVGLTASAYHAQVCRLTVAGLTRERRVLGGIQAECPQNPLHSSPFGNWGASSNYGPKLNGHQFDGWCRQHTYCDNSGVCRRACTDQWFEWNSCTTIPRFQPPNCTLYNHQDCTTQISSTGVNVLGTQTVDVPVRCPFATRPGAPASAGGCRDVVVYSHGTNYLSLYELDPLGPDELIQTLYFPETPVPMSCDVMSCPPAGSEWVRPIAYASPPSPPRVFAELATAVGGGTFLDPYQVCRAAAPPHYTVNAAGFTGPAVAPDSLATTFGAALAPASASASCCPSVPLPSLAAFAGPPSAPRSAPPCAFIASPASALLPTASS